MLKLAIQQQAQLSASQQAQSESNLKTLESAQTKSQTTLSNLENENQTLHQSIEDLKSELQNQYTQFESILESSDDKSINLELSAKIKSQKNTIARNEREVLTWKHKLMSKDDSINDKVKSAQFLKASLKVAEDELEYLREYLNQNNMTPVDQILASRKVKTIRGGGAKSKVVRGKAAHLEDTGGVFKMEQRLGQKFKVVQPKRLDSADDISMAEAGLGDTPVFD